MAHELYKNVGGDMSTDCELLELAAKAIKLRVPNSGTDWLDEMIRTSLRDDLAAKATQTGTAGNGTRTCG